jgi:hypothetical protein
MPRASLKGPLAYGNHIHIGYALSAVQCDNKADKNYKGVKKKTKNYLACHRKQPNCVRKI